jgi:probable F420-dependent oxidoreductase
MKFLFNLPHVALLKAMMQPWEPSVTGADQTRMAKRAEEMGYDMISVPEHFMVPKSHLELSGPFYFHAAAAQGYLAGATSKIRLNSSVTILPLQNPVVLAKALSTIDWLSSGRITVTLGVGWDEEEFKLVGVPFRERGRIMDEYIAAMIELWTQDSPAFEGKYVSFKEAKFEPKPVQKPHIQIWMGGEVDAALKRAARYAEGWWPYLSKPEDFPARIDFIKSQPEYHGQPFDVMFSLGQSRVGDRHVVVDDPDAQPDMGKQKIIDELGRYKRCGVTMTSVPLPMVKSLDAYLDYAQWVIEEIKPALQ